MKALTPSSLITLAPGFLRRHAIALAVIAGLLVLYALAGFFLVPRIARSQIEDYVTATLHRKISLGEIRFNPFTFDASIAGLRLSEADGSLLAAFRHLYVNAELASLWQRAVVLREVDLAAPDVQLVIARDGSVNLARLAPEPARPPPAGEESAPPRVRIGRLAVTEGRVGLEDRSRPRPFTAAVTPIRFVLVDFRTDSGYRNAYSFTGTTTSGEQLQWSGGFTVQPLGSSGVFRMQHLKLATIDSYLYESLPFRLASGEAQLEGSYQFELEPFALDVQLPEVGVLGATLADRSGAAGAPVTLPEINVQDVAFSFEKRDVGLRRLEVKDARLDLVREQDGAINLSRLFDSAPAPAAQDHSDGARNTSGRSPAAAPDSPSWNVHIDTVQVKDAAVIAEDRTVTPAARFELAPVNLAVNSWSTLAGSRPQFDADITIDKQARLASGGELQLDPPGTTLSFDLSGFALAAIQPYLLQATAMTLHSGKLSAKGDLSFSAAPEGAPALKFDGEVRIADLRTTDRLVNQDFVKWRSLAITGIHFGQNPDGLSIDSIVARQPYASVIIARDGTLNVATVLAPLEDAEAPSPTLPRDAGEGAEPSASSKEESPPPRAAADEPPGSSKRQSPPPRAGEGQDGGAGSPLPIRIRSVRVLGGSANFADNSIQPSFATGILDLNGRISGLSSDPASRAQVALQGRVDEYAPVDITGEVNILAAAKYTDLAMNFRNMELTTFNPYSGKFAGYNISRGKLSTELKYRVEDRKLSAQHHIVIDNLEFGEKTDSKDVAPIPMKLAVALLKDRNGVIDVDLPVTGNLDDPKFQLGPIIWKAALGLLKKIVTAPFAVLGALFGGGEELAYVDFPAGSADIGPAEADKLVKLSKALVERPQLKLDVPLTVAGAADSDAIARQALAAQLPQGMPEAPPDERAKRRRIDMLEDAYRKIANAAPEYPSQADAGTDPDAELDARLDYLRQALLDRLKPDQGALDALAQRRARAVQDALLANTGLDPGRVFITSEHGGGPADGDRVRMELKLE